MSRPAGAGADAPRSQTRVPRPPLWLLAFMMSMGPFADTEYTPAMPAMARDLHAPYAMVQLTMAAYLFGSSVSQLVYGPASDRFGRRPVMLVGATILLVGLLLSLLSFSIWPMIGGRLIQGIGACAGGVIADAAVRDAFAAGERKTIYARLNAAFALAPAIGPIFGTFIATSMGWHANFGLLLAMSLVLWVLVYKLLPETHLQLEPRALQPQQLWRNYAHTLSTREFSVFAALGGCGVGVVYAALIGAPDLIINVLHRGNGAFIMVSVAILVAFVIGAGGYALVAGRLSDTWLVSGGLAILLAGSGWLMATAMRGNTHITLADFLWPVGACFIGVGLLLPLCTARAMAPFEQTTGMAASLLGFSRMGVAGLGTVAMSALHQGSVMDIPIVFLGMAAVAVLVFGGYLMTGGNRSAR